MYIIDFSRPKIIDLETRWNRISKERNTHFAFNKRILNDLINQ
jgi:hypothetical protein